MIEHMRPLPVEADSIGSTLTQWQSGHPQMGVFALLPEAERAKLPILQADCQQRGISLVGGIFPALITPQGFSGEGVWLLRLDEMVPAFLLPELNVGEPEAAKKIAKAVESALAAFDASAAKPTLYLIFDGLIPNISTILDGLYLRLADRVNYAGANAGSETFQPMPCAFDGERIIDNGVLGVLLPGNATTILEHGYPAPGRVMTATSTEGNRILSIDWRSAFDAYQEIIKAEYGIDLTRENFYQYAVHFPFGILRTSDEVVVRIPVALADDGSLFCVGEVPENAMLVLLRAPTADAGHCITHLAKEIDAANGPLLNRRLLTFYCAGRHMHLGEDAARELAELNVQTGAAIMAGALSLGEIGSTHEWGYPMFHNAALVCTPWQGT
ncbi:MAG: FIST N-terminal domain-containing protein [Sulfuricellaceae bacterium]|nr:FIST N-terminal domain-containing protein [Sulfuricellaceae bacterium]